MGREHTFDDAGGGGGPCDGLTALAADTVRAVRRLSGSRVETATDDDVMAALLTLEDAASALQSARAELIAHADSARVTADAEGLAVGPWIARRARRPRKVCRTQTTTARIAVEHFPRLLAAARLGQLRWEHVELVCRVSNGRNRIRMSSIQDFLVDQAADRSFESWARLVAQAAREADEDGGYDPNDDVRANRLRIDELPDCTREVKGRLVGSVGVIVTSTLEAIADELFRGFTRDAELDPALQVPSRQTLMALALEEACRRALAVELDGTRQPGTEAVVILHEDDEGSVRATDTTGRPVPVGALESLLGDATFRGLLLDGDGSPLRFGRTRRLATADQRLTLAVRDGGCVFPGCDRPPGWCDAHHQPGWLNGGRSDTDLMALLCRTHHGVTHRSGWDMCADPDRPQRWCWNTPSGRTLRSQRRSDHEPPAPDRRSSPG